jgi:hypothetical protein
VCISPRLIHQLRLYTGDRHRQTKHKRNSFSELQPLPVFSCSSSALDPNAPPSHSSEISSDACYPQRLMDHQLQKKITIYPSLLFWTSWQLFSTPLWVSTFFSRRAWHQTIYQQQQPSFLVPSKLGMLEMKLHKSESRDKIRVKKKRKINGDKNQIKKRDKTIKR